MFAVPEGWYCGQSAAEPRKAGSRALYGININMAVSHRLPIPSAPRIGCCRRYCLPVRPQRLAGLQLHLLPAPVLHGGPAVAVCLSRPCVPHTVPPFGSGVLMGSRPAPGCPKGRASLPPRPCRHPKAGSCRRCDALGVGLSSGTHVRSAALLGWLVACLFLTGND